MHGIGEAECLSLFLQWVGAHSFDLAFVGLVVAGMWLSLGGEVENGEEDD